MVSECRPVPRPSVACLRTREEPNTSGPGRLDGEEDQSCRRGWYTLSLGMDMDLPVGFLDLPVPVPAGTGTGTPGTGLVGYGSMGG